MKNLTVSLPAFVAADDYHDFRFMQHAYQQIGLNVKVEEIGYDEKFFQYIAVVYSDEYPKSKVEAYCEENDVG